MEMKKENRHWSPAHLSICKCTGNYLEAQEGQRLGLGGPRALYEVFIFEWGDCVCVAPVSFNTDKDANAWRRTQNTSELGMGM